MDTIEWNNNVTFSRGKLNAAITYIRDNMSGYLNLSRTERNRLELYGKGKRIPVDTLLSLRRHYQIQKLIYTRYHPNLDMIITTKMAELDKKLKGKNPENTVSELRKFFKEIDVPLTKIHSAISPVIEEYKSKTMVWYLNEFFKKTVVESEKVNKEAKEYELVLQCYLTKLNIPYETEEQLREKGIKLTPDVLLSKPIIIKVDDIEHTVYWIDAKSFTLAPEKYFLKKLTNQAEKYVKEYGKGAFVFKHGICSDIKIENVVCLDGSCMYS